MTVKKNAKDQFMDYLLITAGAVIYGIGVSSFLDPNNLAPGGVTGIAMILNRLTRLPTGTGLLLINVPILAAGLWKFGFRFLVSTLYATFMCSVFTNFFARFGAVTTDPLLAALAGGAAVSYTHIDVYKRQAQFTVCWWKRLRCRSCFSTDRITLKRLVSMLLPFRQWMTLRKPCVP